MLSVSNVSMRYGASHEPLS